MMIMIMMIIHYACNLLIICAKVDLFIFLF